MDIKNNAIEVSMTAIRKRIKVKFIYPIAVIKDYCNKIEKIKKSLQLSASNCSALEDKLKMVYTSIIRNVHYNYISISHSDYTIIGPLFNHSGICEGYAKTLKFFCDIVDVHCILVSGKALNLDNFSNEGHAWDIITFDDKIYSHVDATWDSIRFHKKVNELCYFLLSDTKMENDHTWNKQIVPKCLGNYKEESLCFNGLSEIKAHIYETVSDRNKFTSFVTNLKFNSTEEIVNIIYGMLSRCPQYMVKQFYVIYNKNSNIIECTFEYY
ncbi:MAG: hypothetical protein NC177_12775 [Ruminococcus flavefaciens]|nr:hypothetical protein [Ruminococcus flavefaciens]